MGLVDHEPTIPQVSAQSAASVTKCILVCLPTSKSHRLKLTLHTRAFGNDKHVARLNSKVIPLDYSRDWSEPYTSVLGNLRKKPVG